MDKIDLKRIYRSVYGARNTDWAIVDVPRLTFLTIDGAGDPNESAAYRSAVQALFATSYALKFLSKRELGKDHVVMPLEGLWYADDPAVFVTRDKAQFAWTVMIAQPDWITPELVCTAADTVAAKQDAPLPEALRVQTRTEGLSLQCLHIGSYDAETPKLVDLHERYLPDHDWTFNGDHHEIYLSDPRRVTADKLKTILRQPVRRRDESASH